MKYDTVTAEEQGRLALNAVRNLPDEAFTAAVAAGRLDVDSLRALQHDLEVEHIPVEIQESYAPAAPVPTMPGQEAHRPQRRSDLLAERIKVVKAQIRKQEGGA